MFVCTYVWWPQKTEEGIKSFGIGVTGSCELTCGCSELNLGSLQEQIVLLTVEPSLKPLFNQQDWKRTEFVLEGRIGRA